jgi:dTDP-glucose 4,6-dehydratase
MVSLRSGVRTLCRALTECLYFSVDAHIEPPARIGSDHCSAIREVLARGRVGEVYNIGGWNEKPNIEVVKTLCAMLDEISPRSDGRRYAEQITYVKDRPGHDRRYSIDARKIARELGWKPSETFETGIRKTVRWYLDHQDWVKNVTSGTYRQWVEKHYEATA